MIDIKNLGAYFEQAAVRSDTTEQEIMQLCDDGIRYHFAVVGVAPCNVRMAKDYLGDSPIHLGSCSGAPMGFNTTAVKVLEAETAARDGADEIDLVINIAALKMGRLDYVENEVAAVVDACKSVSEDKVVKAVLETSLLTDDEKKRGCEALIRAGADYAKLATGFGKYGADVRDVKILRSVGGDAIKIKASGGIRTLEFAVELLEAGADRIGGTSGPLLMRLVKERMEDL